MAAEAPACPELDIPNPGSPHNAYLGTSSCGGPSYRAESGKLAARHERVPPRLREIARLFDGIPSGTGALRLRRRINIRRCRLRSSLSVACGMDEHCGSRMICTGRSFVYTFGAHLRWTWAVALRFVASVGVHLVLMNVLHVWP